MTVLTGTIIGLVSASAPPTATCKFVQGPRASLGGLVHNPFNSLHWVDHFSAVNGSAGVAFKVKQARDTDRNVRRIG